MSKQGWLSEKSMIEVKEYREILKFQSNWTSGYFRKCLAQHNYGLRRTGLTEIALCTLWCFVQPRVYVALLVVKSSGVLPSHLVTGVLLCQPPQMSVLSEGTARPLHHHVLQLLALGAGVTQGVTRDKERHQVADVGRRINERRWVGWAQKLLLLRNC